MSNVHINYECRSFLSGIVNRYRVLLGEDYDDQGVYIGDRKRYSFIFLMFLLCVCMILMSVYFLRRLQKMDNLVLCFASVLPAVTVLCCLKVIWGLVIDAFTGGY